MSDILNNKLAKLTIDRYDGKERTSKLGSFEAMFNPSSLSFYCENEYAKNQGINTSAAEAIYLHTTPKNLDLELIIDSTITVDGTQTISVKENVEKFLKLFVMNGDIHQPPFLKISWGEMQWGLGSSSAVFDCRIKSVDITYSLFARSGLPLRATLHTKFIEDIVEEKRVNIDRKNSSDLTHSIEVTDGKPLTSIAFDVYGDSSRYIEIAAYNNLDTVRELKAGTTVICPPIK